MTPWPGGTPSVEPSQPTCACGKTAAPLATPDDRKASYRCPGCGLVIKNQTLPDRQLQQWFEDEYWGAFAQEQVGQARVTLWVHILERIEQLAPERGTVVDVGCGAGAFLGLCRDRGWRGIGFELSERAVRHAQAQGLDVRQEGWPPATLGDSTVEVVTCINVLDLMPRPFDTLREAWRVLKPGGLLYVRVLNGPVHLALSAAARRFHVPNLSMLHLYGFGKPSLRFHLARLGFQEVDVRTSPPTQTDAYRHDQGPRALLRTLCKQVDRLVYSAARSLHLDWLAYGLSLEATARKPIPAEQEPRP